MSRKIIIPVNKLYHGYKDSLKPYFEKYFNQDGNPLQWKNVPITLFAIDYVNVGKEIKKNLSEHPFILYEYERYAESESVINDIHKKAASRRIMKMVDSIRKHGYAEGRYRNDRHLIRVRRGFSSPYGDDDKGFTLAARKHRAAACLALGMTHIRVKIGK